MAGTLENTLQQRPRWRRYTPDRLFLKQLDNLRQGRLHLSFEQSGERFELGDDPAPSAEIVVHNTWALIRAVSLRGDLGFGEAYMAGHWSSPDLSALLYLLSINLDGLNGTQDRSLPVRWLCRLQHALNRNSITGSRRNIRAHYDLGNDFYARWLDASMTYSSAIFDQTRELYQAQQQKYERLFDLVDPEPGEHILEIGCGWGGFVEHAACRGVAVTGITLSREQYDYARERLAVGGHAERAEVRLMDYRHLEGQFDHIVSIEMFEAVGQAYWKSYFEKISQCLRPGGRAALQVITIRDDMFEQYRRQAGGFIQKYIFPGGMLPTNKQLRDLAWQAGLEPLKTDHLGQHYADTLALWAENFRSQRDWLASHGYDMRFQRMWEYYLAFCEAGFRDGRIDVVQFCAQKEQASK